MSDDLEKNGKIKGNKKFISQVLTGKSHHLLLFRKDLDNSTRQKIGEAGKGKIGAHPSLSTES